MDAHLHIAPSLASADLLCLGEAIRELERAGAEVLHLDIEDGNFVPNLTFGRRMLQQIRAATALPFCIHLMVTDPLFWVRELRDLGPARVAFHVEAAPYPLRVVRALRSQGMAVGLAFNPRTPLAPAAYLRAEVDYLLLLTSEPDGAGEPYLPGLTAKVQEALTWAQGPARERLETPPADHQVPAAGQPPGAGPWVLVDGGLGLAEVRQLYATGVRHFVLGRALFGGGLGEMRDRLGRIYGEAERWN